LQDDQCTGYINHKKNKKIKKNNNIIIITTTTNLLIKNTLHVTSINFTVRQYFVTLEKSNNKIHDEITTKLHAADPCQLRHENFWELQVLAVVVLLRI